MERTGEVRRTGPEKKQKSGGTNPSLRGCRLHRNKGDPWTAAPSVGSVGDSHWEGEGPKRGPGAAQQPLLGCPQSSRASLAPEAPAHLIGSVGLSISRGIIGPWSPCAHQKKPQWCLPSASGSPLLKSTFKACLVTVASLGVAGHRQKPLFTPAGSCSHLQ